MWAHEHSADTDLSPETIWHVLSNIDDWITWDTSMEQIHIHGPFAVGTQISMKPTGQDPIRSTIVEIRPNEVYADETTFGDVRLRFSHTLRRLGDGGTRLTHRLEISGPTADEVGPQLGPSIIEDFPDAMAALLARAAAG